MTPSGVGLAGFLLFAAFLVASDSVAAQAATAPHSANVAEARHEPTPVPRGVDVTAHLRLQDGTDVRSVTMIYCRAENYACAPNLTMERDNDSAFEAPIRWNAGFFRGATNVGYNFTIRYADGHNETSPLHNWPYTPEALPDGAGNYYFYPLEGGEGAPVPAPMAPMILVATFLLAQVLRRKAPP